MRNREEVNVVWSRFFPITTPLTHTRRDPPLPPHLPRPEETLDEVVAAAAATMEEAAAAIGEIVT